MFGTKTAAPTHLGFGSLEHFMNINIEPAK